MGNYASGTTVDSIECDREFCNEEASRSFSRMVRAT